MIVDRGVDVVVADTLRGMPETSVNPPAPLFRKSVGRIGQLNQAARGMKMSSLPSLSQSISPTPPLIDSTIYFLSA